jgi:hypothetical protein
MSNDTRVKIFVRLTPERAEALRQAIKKNGSTLTQQDVIESLIENYLAHATESQTRHLDGSICPISALISGLANSVSEQWRMLEGFRQGVKVMPPAEPH